MTRRLRAQAHTIAAVWASQAGTARLMLEAADLIDEMGAALELSRVWWDETASPYHGGWNHAGFPCDRNPCAACRARSSIMAIVGKAV